MNIVSLLLSFSQNTCEWKMRRFHEPATQITINTEISRVSIFVPLSCRHRRNAAHNQRTRRTTKIRYHQLCDNDIIVALSFLLAFPVIHWKSKMHAIKCQTQSKCEIPGARATHVQVLFGNDNIALFFFFLFRCKVALNEYASHDYNNIKQKCQKDKRWRYVGANAHYQLHCNSIN